jgi:hypothetical protein
MGFLVATTDNATMRLGRWLQPFVEQFARGFDARLYNDWDSPVFGDGCYELAKAEESRENWEPDELPLPTTAARISGSSTG